MTGRRPPHDPRSDDGFDAARDATELLRRELADVRREIEALVRQEVGKSAADPRKLDAIVQDAVRREVRREVQSKTPWVVTQINWLAPALGVAVGLALGLSAWAALSMRGAAADPTTLASAGTTAAGAGDAAASTGTTPTPTQVAATAPIDPSVRAASYDSMLAAGSTDLAPLIERLEDAAPAADIRTSIAAWRSGQITPAHAQRLHSAFVQLELRQSVAPDLLIDGIILRNPCRGSSCGALLELWRSTAPTGWPAYTDRIAADTAAVRRAELLLVSSSLFASAP